MYRVFRTDHYLSKLAKLDGSERQRVEKFEQSLKVQPYSGKPLSYRFFREKKFNGKRMLFLIYDDMQVVYLITLTDKKAQQSDIDQIKNHLDLLRRQVDRRYGEEI